MAFLPPDQVRALGALSVVGLSFVLALVIGVAAGVWLDRHAGTSPWGFLVGFALGVAAGILNVYRATTASDALMRDADPFIRRLERDAVDLGGAGGRRRRWPSAPISPGWPPASPAAASWPSPACGPSAPASMPLLSRIAPARPQARTRRRSRRPNAPGRRAQRVQASASLREAGRPLRAAGAAAYVMIVVCACTRLAC